MKSKKVQLYYIMISHCQEVILKAVNDVSFTFQSDEILSIVGESGSGKATTAKMILGLLKPTSGEIFFDGKTSQIFQSTPCILAKSTTYLSGSLFFFQHF